jgi:glycosyltransferase involved in cell wall biosynthesis
MSTGLPVILMDYSGLSDVAKPDFAYPLEPDGYERVNPMQEQPGNWAKISIPQLMYWMRYVYEHQEEAMKKGKLASNEMYENNRWEVCAKKMKKYLEQIDEMSSV